jgi:hypothetical protein
MDAQPGFWRSVRQEALAGLIVIGAGATMGGIGYLVYTVPSRLDDLLQSQARFEKQITALEDRVDDQGQRILKLELSR